MKKSFGLFLIIIFSSCSEKASTNPITINYYADDQQFVDELIELNTLTLEDIADSIVTVEIDSGSIRYYKISELHLGNMDLDSIPSSIGNLESLIVLMINNNNLQYLTESICTIYDQLESLNFNNNDICTPTIPDCIDQNTTISEFYSSQGCEILPDDGDRRFLLDLIDANWPDTSAGFIDTLKNMYVEWEDYRVEGILVSRITEIRFDSKNILSIPNSIAQLDSIIWFELQNNRIEIIPEYIGGLTRLEELVISNNKIKILPPQIGNLSNLKVLKIDSNSLEEIHENIGKLSNLNTLWLSDNQITSLPQNMCNIIANFWNEDGQYYEGLYIGNNLLCLSGSSCCDSTCDCNNNDCFTELIEDSIQSISCE